MTGKHSTSRQPAYRGRAVALAIEEDVRLYARHRRQSVTARLWRRAAVLGGVGVAAIAATLGGVHEASPGGLGGFGEVDAVAEPAPPAAVVDAPAGDTTIPAGPGLLMSGGLVGVAERGVLDVPDPTVTSPPSSTSSPRPAPTPTPTPKRSLATGSVADTSSAPSPSRSAEEPSTTHEPTSERPGESSTRHPRSEHTESRPSHTDDSTSPQPTHDHGDQDDQDDQDDHNDDDSTDHTDSTHQTGDNGSDGLLGGLLG